MVNVHLVDGTYDLYRMYYGSPKYKNKSGKEIGACRSFIRYLTNLIATSDITHIGVAFSTVIESFRNDMIEGYKTSERVEPELFDQFILAEEITQSLGIQCWGMIEYEADDAIATAAISLIDNSEVDQVIILSADKDFAQLLDGDKILLVDNVRNKSYNEASSREKWGVAPGSIPDLLGLTGDKADGIPGIKGWGQKSASQILQKYKHIENIPDESADWGLKIRSMTKLAKVLKSEKNKALIYRDAAILKTDLDISCSLNDLVWNQVNFDKLVSICKILEMEDFILKFS